MEQYMTARSRLDRVLSAVAVVLLFILVGSIDRVLGGVLA